MKGLDSLISESQPVFLYLFAQFLILIIMIISDFYLFIFIVIILSYEAEFLPGTCTGFVNEGGHVCHCDSRLIFY